MNPRQRRQKRDRGILLMYPMIRTASAQSYRVVLKDIEPQRLMNRSTVFYCYYVNLKLMNI